MKEAQVEYEILLTKFHNMEKNLEDNMKYKPLSEQLEKELEEQNKRT